jgi:hypothetical protein
MMEMWGEMTDTIKKDTETLVDTIKEVGLEVNIKGKLIICYCSITRIQSKVIRQK